MKKPTKNDTRLLNSFNLYSGALNLNDNSINFELLGKYTTLFSETYANNINVSPNEFIEFGYLISDIAEKLKHTFVNKVISLENISYKLEYVNEYDEKYLRITFYRTITEQEYEKLLQQYQKNQEKIKINKTKKKNAISEKEKELLEKLIKKHPNKAKQLLNKSN